MSREYSLNTESAKRGDGGGRINQTGAYVGKFTRAEAVTSKKGTEGVEFALEADDGAQADFLTLWTHNAEGKELFGLGMLNAIMTCMKIKALAPQKKVMDKWDQELGSKVPKEIIIYPELMGKSVGLLLQREEYLKQNGDVGEKMGIAGSYEAGTGFTASEILDKSKTPEKLAKKKASLKDKTIDTTRTQRAPSGGISTPDDPFGDMADDIPFITAWTNPIWKVTRRKVRWA